MATVLAGCASSASEPNDPDASGATTGAATGATTGAPDGSGPEPAQEPATFTIASTGDLLPHTALQQSARVAAGGAGYDFDAMFDRVRGRLAAADLAVCHMETPLSQDNSNLSGYPTFSVPYQLADAVAAAGYDTCSTASNHSLDKGPSGAAATLQHLGEAGVKHAGSGRTPEETAAPARFLANGVDVALLSYTYGQNGHPDGSLPPSLAAHLNVIDPERILADAAAAKADGAEFVVVSLHWGQQYNHAATSFQHDVARQLLGSPQVDLILGHHAHVVQPIEKIGSKYVVYGTGNFLSNYTGPADRIDGVIVTLTVTRQPGETPVVTGVTYTPTYVDFRNGHVVHVVSDDFAAATDPAAPDPAAQQRLLASWQRTSSYIGAAPSDVVPENPVAGLPVIAPQPLPVAVAMP